LIAAALLSMVVGNAIMLWNTRVQMRQGYGDFASSYAAGTLVRRGLGAQLYSPAAQWKVQQEFASEVKIRHGPLCYLRPPFEALFFSGLAAWPYPAALVVLTGVKLALLAAIPFIVVRARPWKEASPLWLTGILILGTFPAFMDLLLGQDAVLLAFLFAICFWQLDTGHDMGAGVTLGLALFKFQLALPFVGMLWIAGRRRILPGFAISGSAVLAVSAALVGWRGLFKYPGYLLALNRTRGLGIAPQVQITLRGLLTRFMGDVSYSGRILWLLVPVAIGAIVYAGFIWRRAGEGFLAEGFGLAAVVAIVTSYYASDYDLLLLIVPLLAIRTRAHHADADANTEVPEADRINRYLEAGGLLLLLLTPVYWFTRTQLHSECLMAIPLMAVGVALARTLRSAGAVKLRAQEVG